jgi:hypothetical protein
MGEDFEKNMKKYGGMTSVRKMAELLELRPLIANSGPIVANNPSVATTGGVATASSMGTGALDTGNSVDRLGARF